MSHIVYETKCICDNCGTHMLTEADLESGPLRTWCPQCGGHDCTPEFLLEWRAEEAKKILSRPPPTPTSNFLALMRKAERK